MPHIKREQFAWDFIRLGKIPDIYNSIIFNNKNYASSSSDKKPNNPSEKVIYVSLFPTYLTSSIKDEEMYYLKKIPHINYSGAGISFEKSETFDAFLSKNLKPQIRKNLRRSINRLEKSFNISYKHFYGDLDKKTYQYLLKNLKTMLEKRSAQKNIENYFLLEWDQNINDLFRLIIDKKASFFVIYDGNKPINISINKHFKGIMLFSECNSYDINYGKYSLGHLDNYLKTKWCIDNSYAFLDLGIGVTDEKKNWCNLFYDFEYHIYYKKHSTLGKLLALFEIVKIKAKNVVKEFKLKAFLKQLKATLIKKRSVETYKMPYKLENLESLPDCESADLKKININQPEAEHLKQPVYDYLDSNNEHINNINIY